MTHRGQQFALTLVVLVALLATIGQGMAVAAQTQADHSTTDLPVRAFRCQTDPGRWSPESGKPLDPYGCVPLSGVAIHAMYPDGTRAADCTTGGDGMCTLKPVSSLVDIILKEDAGTLPDGYVARDAQIVTRAFSEFRGATFFNLPTGSSPAPTRTPGVSQPTPTSVPAVAGSTAAIYQGDCEPGPFRNPVAKLTNVRTPAGVPVGPGKAVDVQLSDTTVDVSLTQMLLQSHALVVFDEANATLPLVCGVVSGIMASDGSLTIALVPQNKSLYAGVAKLTPDGNRTRVEISLAQVRQPGQ